jgi:hypothetical protein
MILHAVSVAAVFVDQLAQAQTPVQIQCVQAAPEPTLKWLLPTIVQTLISLVSIGVGVGIAVWSFRKNRQSEHEQWIRDQKKCEWKELLQTASGIEAVIPAVAKIQERYDLVSECLPQRIAQLQAVRASCVFLSEFLYLQESVVAFTEFVQASAGAAESLQGFNAQTETDPAVRQFCRTKYDEIRDAYLKFCNWLRTQAQMDIGGRRKSEGKGDHNGS